MTFEIANSPCSWGVNYADSPDNPDPKKVFREIAEAGYKFSELGPYGYLQPDTQKILDFTENLNLKIIGSFIFDNLHIESEHHRIKKTISKSCALLEKINSKVFVIIDHITKERMETSGNQTLSVSLNNNDHKKMVNFINEIANMCFEEFGILPVLHPHAGSHIEYEYEIDRILNDVKSDHLALCLDTGHLHYCKVDPYKAIIKYSSKIKHMHFKDINQKILNSVYEEKIDFDTAVKMGVFCPLGSGIIDFKKVYKNLDEISYSGYATIEQDIDPNEGLDPLQYVKKSLVYLNNLKN